MVTAMQFTGTPLAESLVSAAGSWRFWPGVQHAAAAVHAAVAAGERGGQHHEVDDAGGGNDADLGEGQHERAAGGADAIPREDGDDDEDCANIEDQDAPQDIVDRAFQRHLRVLGFPGGDAHQLNP